jgi:Divergent InlB B-repeat domain
MKTKSIFARLMGLCLLTFAASVQADTGPTILSGPPPIAFFTIKTETNAPKAAGASVTGGGSYANDSTATLAAFTSNDCYVFANWTIAGSSVKITNNPYIFTVTKNETVTANFALLEYSILTHSYPTNAGTVSGGGEKACGSIATLKATAKPGFAFSSWTFTGPQGGSGITNNPYKIDVSGNEEVVALFKDIEKPTIKTTAPASGEKIPSAAFILEGSAADNVAVAGVYYDLNGAGWELASNENNFAFWYAYVTLAPNSTNTVSAYAVDTSGNISTTNTVNFICTAAGLAPMSIAGQLAVVDEGTNASDTNYVSFDSAVYVKWSPYTNSGSEVGTYTYTPTGPDTAELVPQHVLPTQDTGTNNSTLELTFTDAYYAIFTNLSGGSGSVSFGAMEESVPPTLDGVTVATTSGYSGDKATISFDSASFTTEDNGAGSSSGTYTFTPFTLVDALVVQTYTNPPANVGTTNFIILMFNEGYSPASGYYSAEILDSSGVVSLDTGSFTTTSNKVTTKFTGPITLAGQIAALQPTGYPHLDFTRSFGRGTFASIFTPTDLSLLADEPNDVGIHLSNTRVSENTGEATFLALAPPYDVGVDNETVEAFWKSPTLAIVTNVVTGQTATIDYSLAKDNAPAALIGHTITTTQDGKTSTFTFNYNNIIGGGGAAGNFGTYTYAPFTPVMALVTITSLAISSAGEVEYVLLYFKTPDSGTFVSAKGDVLKPGTFTMK